MNKPLKEMCRICLSTAVERDIGDLKVGKNEDMKSYVEVLSFCLDIQVTNETTLRKLCIKCFNKILSFYKFKVLALKNDVSLRNCNPDCTVKLEVFVREQAEDEETGDIFYDNIDTYYNDRQIDVDASVKEELHIKNEADSNDYQSDDELLAHIRDTKYNNDSCKEDTEKIPQAKKIRFKKKKGVSEKNRQMCPQCGKEVWNLRLHARKHLPLDQKRLYNCLSCNKSFASYQSMRKHYKIKHLGMKKHCDICNKDVVNLRAHRLQVHEKESMQFVCMICNRRFITQCSLEEHVLLHTEERPHSCDICHKTFRLKFVMINHKRAVHEEEKSHLCQFCPKSFFKKQHLEQHLRTHTRERPYKCSECDKLFSSSSTLKTHQILHTGERKYQCHMCDSSFSQSGNLNKHLIIHTREKKFKCKYCDVKFGRQDHRKRHEYTAHEKHLIALNLTTT